LTDKGDCDAVRKVVAEHEPEEQENCEDQVLVLQLEPDQTRERDN